MLKQKPIPLETIEYRTRARTVHPVFRSPKDVPVRKAEARRCTASIQLAFDHERYRGRSNRHSPIISACIPAGIPQPQTRYFLPRPGYFRAFLHG